MKGSLGFLSPLSIPHILPASPVHFVSLLTTCVDGTMAMTLRRSDSWPRSYQTVGPESVSFPLVTCHLSTL